MQWRLNTSYFAGNLYFPENLLFRLYCVFFGNFIADKIDTFLFEYFLKHFYLCYLNLKCMQPTYIIYVTYSYIF